MSASRHRARSGVLLASYGGALLVVGCFPSYRFEPAREDGGHTDASAAVDGARGEGGLDGGAGDAAADARPDVLLDAACSPLPAPYDASWTPPAGTHQGQCSVGEINAFALCLGNGSGVPTCLAGVSSGCSGCIVSAPPSGLTRASGPLVQNPFAPGHYGLNLPGCIALLAPQEKCPPFLQALETCESAACSPTCLGSVGQFEACAAAADQTVCADASQLGDPCGAAGATGAPAASCFVGGTGAFDRLVLTSGAQYYVGLFCGP